MGNKEFKSKNSVLVVDVQELEVYYIVRNVYYLEDIFSLNIGKGWVYIFNYNLIKIIFNYIFRCSIVAVQTAKKEHRLQYLLNVSLLTDGTMLRCDYF